MVSYRFRRLWRPPAETLEALTTVLGERWRAATRSGAARLFRPVSASWLRVQTAASVVPVRLTTSPRVAGSSGTRPGPHRY